MASSYVNNLRLNEMATGDASGTWGTVTNTNLELIGEALGFGTRAIANASTDNITIADGATDSDRAMYLKLTGGGQACTVTLLPNTVSKLWFMENGTNSALTFTQGSGANVIIPAGDTKLIASNGGGSGAIVYDVLASLSVVDLKVQDDLTLTSDSAVVSFGADADTTLTHTDGSGLTLNSTNKLMFNDASQFIQGSSATVLSIGATNEIDLTSTLIDINGNATVSGTLGVTGVVTANAGVVVDEMTLDADTLTATDDFILDAAGVINLDSDGGGIYFKDDGTTIAEFINNSSDFELKVAVQDKDIRFRGNDGGTAITALTLDMSDAGSATFSHNVKLPDNGVVALGAGSDLALSSNGTNGTIAAPNGTLTIDVAGDLTLDAGGGDIFLKDDGTQFGTIAAEAGGLGISSAIVQDSDIIFKGNDGGATITALTLDMSASGNAFFNSAIGIGISSGADAQLDVRGSNASVLIGEVNRSQFFRIQVLTAGQLVFNDNDVAERMRIETGGNVLVGTTNQSPAESSSVTGIRLGSNGGTQISAAGIEILRLNRNTNDGTLVNFCQAASSEGHISVSGTTVSYNGGHLSRWSRLLDNSKDTSIVKGTVMTNLDEMVEWGDEDNEQLNKMAVSSVEGDANVAGVFVNWDNDDDWNDMNVAMTGDMVIRIAQGTTVARGDLLMSAGDGTAKTQDDDIVRSKTIAKVTSTNVSHTYDDGTYLVPCVLMAC